MLNTHHPSRSPGRPKDDCTPSGGPAQPGLGAQSTRAISLEVAADLQDDLMVACTDLDRLEVLLADACKALMESFREASEQLALHRRRTPARELAGVLAHVQKQLGSAVTALQFEDLSSQLIRHTHQRLRNCADRIASEAFATDEDGEGVIGPAPLRPNPVTQAEMDVGSIELF